MAFAGAGTRTSPIAIDDSEEEVFNELSKGSTQSSPRNGVPMPLTQGTRSRPFPATSMSQKHSETRATQSDKKRKRASSLTSQDVHRAGPSNSQSQNPSLVNRLSQPESKKARKRRRKAERQAVEDLRLQNINWLNNTTFVPPVAPLPALPYPFWPTAQDFFTQVSSANMQSHIPDDTLRHAPYFGGQIQAQNLARSLFNNPYDETPFFEPWIPRSPSPTPPPPPLLPPPTPPRTTDWVSSMALAGDNFPLGIAPSLITPTSPQMPLPLAPPLPAPPPHIPNPSAMSIPKTTEQHALPPKPPPPQQIQTIGMKPDQDPNSKHGVFHFTGSTKEAGKNAKKKPANYMPNPARTLVMEQLPKSHRSRDFVRGWCRTACGAYPVNLFIDAPTGKALVEFATAELARKAWSSPKLGTAYAGLKSHQLKGKPREDLIKVWWYRVDGVGAGGGVGEIEEGEIEGELADKEIAEIMPKESKKEKKARLAREREAKQLRKSELQQVRDQAEQERQTENQAYAPVDPLQLSTLAPTSSSTHPVVSRPPARRVPFPAARDRNFISQHDLAPEAACNSPTSRMSDRAPLPFNRAAYGASLQGDPDDHDSIASSAGRSVSPSADPHSAISSVFGKEDGLEDSEDMEVDLEETFLVYPEDQLPSVAPPVHHSLPSRPSLPMHLDNAPPQKPPSLPPQAAAAAPPFVPRSSITTAPPSIALYPITPLAVPQTKMPLPTRLPLPVPPITTPIALQPSARSSPIPASSSSTTSTTPVPSEPKAMKNAPTEPSFTKRALIARQKELEERIAKSKIELAAAAAAAAASKPGTPGVSGQSQPLSSLKPSTDLGEKQALEDLLRQKVLESRKPVPKLDVASPTIAQALPVTADKLSDKTSTASLSTLSLTSQSFSLEDLAVSFITQTIETIKSRPPSIPDPPPRPARSQSSMKLELAAKQKRLEDHIAESKSLMSQLTQARTKAEKDAIMKVMREKTRLFEDGTRALTEKTDSTSTSTNAQQIQVSRWPVSHQDAGVLILSDDEDEDD